MMVVGLRHEINVNDVRVRRESITVADYRGITDSGSLPTVTYAFRIQQKEHTRAIWKNGLTRAGANIN
jgi:hypothetical protein